MQYGFVLDQSRCIGCHACTVACKSENHVPVGDFRTWVKYTEQGEFPDTRRSFTVLRCNQCTEAPCVTICPVVALDKRPDGIVDIDPRVCIGCKACMQACPYDALYLNAERGVAEKCHFCAHRVTRGLAPACAVVCPTEAIVPGDFDDPESAVARLLARGDLQARKPEAGTRPNVHYVAATEAGIAPLATSAAGGFLWANGPTGARLEAERFAAASEAELARTTYDVPRSPHWGAKVSAYLFTKSVAAGALLAVLPVAWFAALEAVALARVAALALLFLALTGLLLIADLKRPGRFWMILARPNWASWLVRGTIVILVYGALLIGWMAVAYLELELDETVRWSALGLTGAAAALTACYTAFLFAQSKGRVLWMQRGLWFHLIVQAYIGGCAVLLFARPWLGWGDDVLALLAEQATVGLVLHVLFDAVSRWLAPRARRAEYRRAHGLMKRGPLARAHRLAVGLALAAIPFLLPYEPHIAAWLAPAGGALALAAILAAEDVFVRAGQALPIS